MTITEKQVKKILNEKGIGKGNVREVRFIIHNIFSYNVRQLINDYGIVTVNQIRDIVQPDWKKY
jgi:hypothetical protein